MSEQKESSVLFSLKELMNLEEDRIKTEENVKANQVRAAEEARRAAEQAAVQAEQARIAAEEERRRLDEQRGREEAARLEAIRQAEVEKARLEAEGQSRMAAMAAQQQHERQLVAIKSDQSKKTLRNAVIGLIVAVLAIAGIGGFVMYNRAQDADAARIAFEKEKAELQKERERLENDLKATEAQKKDLQGAIALEKDERKKAELQAKLNAVNAQEEETKTKITKAGGPAVGVGAPATQPDKPPAAKPACNCKATDPLCDCL